jgi:hypothetical protein
MRPDLMGASSFYGGWIELFDKLWKKERDKLQWPLFLMKLRPTHRVVFEVKREEHTYILYKRILSYAAQERANRGSRSYPARSSR